MSTAPGADDTYEVYALRYASLPDRRASESFYRFDLYGEPDRPAPMDFFFWLVRNNDRTLLVDCGYTREVALARGRDPGNDPVELLSRLDVRPADVEHVILSHMHYDHVGNINLFPNATFSMARAELDFWTGPYSDRPAIAWVVEPQEVAAVKSFQGDGRLHLVEDSELVFPGVRATRLAGHTPGQLIIEIATRSGQVVLASDAIHYFDEMELDRPFILFTDIEGMYRSYETLRNLSARPSTVVVAGHDPAVRERFRVVDADCVDLTTQTGRPRP